MANEAYDRLKQCIQTREAGIRTIWAAQVTQPGLTARAVSSDGRTRAIEGGKSGQGDPP